MTSPVGKFVNNVPQTSTVSPCGEGNYSVSTNIEIERPFQVTWNTNNNNDNGQNAIITLLYNNEQVYMNLTQASFNNRQTYIRVPTKTPTGPYKLQWHFQSTYTCAQIEVINSTINEYTLTPSLLTTAPLREGGFDYYDFQLTNNGYNAFIDAVAPAGSQNPNDLMTVIVSAGLLNVPNLTNYDQKEDSTLNNTLTFSSCNDNNAADVLIGVYGGQGATGNYTLEATSYNPLINVGGSFESGPHTGARYFTTQAYTTSGSPRRVVVRTTNAIFNANSNYGMLVGPDCGLQTSVVVGKNYGDDVGCANLATGSGTKYIMIPPTSSSYTISTEDGACDDVSGTSFAKFSLLLVIGAIIVLI